MKDIESLKISGNTDVRALHEKMRMAEGAFERARASLEKGELTVETGRYLNQLFTSMAASEATMSW